jgi:hypothetical protein
MGLKLELYSCSRENAPLVYYIRFVFERFNW